MRVGFNACYLWHPSRRGFNRYTYSLAKALAGLGEVQLYLISDQPVHSSFLEGLPAEVVVERGFRHLWWEQRSVPRLVRELGLDVFHAPASIGLPLVKRCAYVLTIHDAVGRAAPDVVPRASAVALFHHRVRERASLASADAIITVSSYSKQEIVRLLGVPAGRVTVIPEAAEEKFRVMEPPEDAGAVLAQYDLRDRFVLYVGGFDRRKNVRSLVEAFARSRASRETDLVLVGERTAESAELSQRADGLGVSSRTRFLGYVPDDDLPALYNAAAVYVYPSLYEGFGLQLVEAMACGVPVIASNRTSLPEVLDGAGLLVEPEAIDEIAAAIDSLFFDRELAAGLRERGLRVAGQLSWKRTALETMDVYRAAIARVSRHRPRPGEP